MKTSILLTVLFLITGLSKLSSQQVYLSQGKIVKVESFIKNNNMEAAIKAIDSLANHVDENLSKKEKIQYQLELKLLKAKIYDDNFELESSLNTLLSILDASVDSDFHKITTRAYLLMSSTKEKGNDLDESERYLKLAKQNIEKYKFDDLYSIYYNRKASFHRLKEQFDELLESANNALKYAEKYKNEEEIALAYTLLGVGKRGKMELDAAVEYYKKSIPYYRKLENHTNHAIMYRNIARIYFYENKIDQSFLYLDSAYLYYDRMNYFYKEQLPLLKFDLFYLINKKDSAVEYLMKFHNDSFFSLAKRQSNAVKEITEKYDNDKKEDTIKGKNQQLLLIGILLGVILIAAFLLIRQNRRIKSQNKVINKQLEELMKTVEQKQVLLSELQHRVKNNLQHVISILEIQKESVDFNNIDELIRGNQNRIHSMALLHKKLNVAENVNEIDLKRYVNELSELVKDSYYSFKKNIQLDIQCEIENLSIEKALPLGLIIVELESNSIKHAFKKRASGMIHIEITKDPISQQKRLYYADNGNGFDFNRTDSKGLGLEIIKGLIDQLDGTVESNDRNGFELTILF